jgi:RimJ/RimL family protein N-acetyltransferase
VEGYTSRLSIAPLARADVPELFAALEGPQVRRYLGGSAWTSPEEMDAWAARVLAGPPAGARTVAWVNLVVRLRSTPDAVAGRLQATVYDEWAEVAWVLAPEHWGRGLGTEAAQLLLHHLRESFGITEVWATADPANTASLALLRRLDFAEQPVPPARHPASFDAGDVVMARLVLP